MVGRADKAVAYGEDALFAVGGERNPQCSGSAPQDDVEKLGVHPESDGWAVISDLPDERFRNAAVVVEGWLYIFGGQRCTNQIVEARRESSRSRFRREMTY